MKRVVLRDYQEKAAQEAVAASDNFLINAPTGSGKSFIIGRICELSPNKVLVLSHTRELVRQDADSIERLIGEKPSIYCAGLGAWDMSGRIVVGTIQSMNRCDSIMDFSNVIVDECHRIADWAESSYRTLLKKIPKAKLIGLSATPYRMSNYLHGETSEYLFKDIHFNISVEELVDRGFLIMPDFKRGITKTDISQVGINGDFIVDQVQSVYLERINEIVDECAQIIPKRNRALIFCVAIEQSEEVARMLRERGIKAECVSSNTSVSDREKISNDFKVGRLQALTSVNIFLEGWDVPEADTAVLIRPTRSPGLYAQSVGRIMRPASGKKNALVIDFGQNYSRFGAINKMGIPRILETKEEREIEKNRYRKPCAKCGFLNLKIDIECIECGHVFLSTRSYKFRHGYGLQPFDIELIEHWFVYRNCREEMKEMIERYSPEEIFKHIEMTKFFNVSNKDLWNSVEMFMKEEGGYQFHSRHNQQRSKIIQRDEEDITLIKDVKEMKQAANSHFKAKFKIVPPVKDIINPRLSFREHENVRRKIEMVKNFQSRVYIMPYLFKEDDNSLKILLLYFHDGNNKRHFQLLSFNDEKLLNTREQWNLISKTPYLNPPNDLEEAWRRKKEIGGSKILEFILRHNEIQVFK